MVSVCLQSVADTYFDGSKFIHVSKFGKCQFYNNSGVHLSNRNIKDTISNQFLVIYCIVITYLTLLGGGGGGGGGGGSSSSSSSSPNLH